MVMLRPKRKPPLASMLLERSEGLLRESEAKRCMAEAATHSPPFYYGMYGGSELSGLLDSDERTQSIFREHGYREAKRSYGVVTATWPVLNPVVDRRQMQIRRTRLSKHKVDPPTLAPGGKRACSNPSSAPQCSLQVRRRCQGIGSPISGTSKPWPALGACAVGISGLGVTSPQRRQGLATYLLGEAAVKCTPCKEFRWPRYTWPRKTSRPRRYLADWVSSRWISPYFIARIDARF